MTRALLYDFITRHPLAVLSTVTASGESESALMRIVATPDLEIFFDTRTVTRKYRNFLANPACSLVIGCSGPASVQYEGTLAIPEAPELGRLKELYFTVAPQARERVSWPDVAYLVVRPRWIRYSDYSVQPPEVAEFTVS